MKDDIEVALIAFLMADPAVRDIVQTLPQPPRVFPNIAPQGFSSYLPYIVYEVLEVAEPHVLDEGPSTLATARILLHCQQKGASMIKLRLLEALIRRSSGPDPSGKKLDGFRGQWPGGYTIQRCRVLNQHYEFDRPIKAEEVGTQRLTLEVTVSWNTV